MADRIFLLASWSREEGSGRRGEGLPRGLGERGLWGRTGERCEQDFFEQPAALLLLSLTQGSCIIHDQADAQDARMPGLPVK